MGACKESYFIQPIAREKLKRLSARSRAAAWALGALALCFSPAAWAGESREGGWTFQAGAGLGAQYGVLGASVEARCDLRRIGFSAALGVPYIPTATLGLWLPGRRFSLGVLGHAGFQPVLTSCGTDPAKDPGRRCHAVLAGANLALDHDVGALDGLVLRYGVGLTMFGAGGGGTILPFSLGLAWKW